jgi:hypothetical protein
VPAPAPAPQVPVSSSEALPNPREAQQDMANASSAHTALDH